MGKILIVEYQKAISRVLQDILSNELENYEIFTVEDGLKSYKTIEKEDFALVISDIKISKLSGIDLLRQALQIKPELNFIIISENSDIETVIKSLKEGAHDFIPKPIDINRLITSVKNALNKKDTTKNKKNLPEENIKLRKRINKKHQMIGESPVLKEIQNIINKIAPYNVKVLITGPTGTGKELIAHALHNQSKRCDKPIIEVNCAAIPSELIESELFGHVKGSFTGAVKDKQGKFELANGGTIFLDEIGDMSLIAQAKVLRILQEGKVCPVGSDKEIKVDVRVISATNKNLNNEIRSGKFREDLFHRLSVVEIHVPPLDERKEDISLLVKYFAQQISKEYGSIVKKFSKDAIETLKNFKWPGNIRELRNVVERLIILGANPVTKKDVLEFVKNKTL